MTNIATILFIFLSTFISQTISSNVKSITDGDTLILENGQKIRLACIDAPERNQLYGKEATERLKEFLPSETPIKYIQVDVDKYGRIIAVVFAHVNGKQTNINVQMVQEGYAVVFYNYLDNCPGSRQQLLEAEKKAQQKKT